MRFIYILFAIYNKIYNQLNNEVNLKNDACNVYFELRNNDFIGTKANNTVIKMNITTPQYEYDRKYELKLV